jgi:hypothetical protein
MLPDLKFSRWLTSDCGLMGRAECTIKIEAACSSETVVTIYKTTRRQNPEQQHRQLSIMF